MNAFEALREMAAGNEGEAVQDKAGSEHTVLEIVSIRLMGWKRSVAWGSLLAVGRVPQYIGRDRSSN